MPIINAQVSTLHKVEWFEGFIKARERAFSKSNVLGSWNGAGLVPFNPCKLHWRVGRKSTPTPPSSPKIANVSLTSFFNDVFTSPVNPTRVQAASNLLNKQLEQPPYVNTPKRKFIKELMARMERIESRCVILSAEKANAEEVLVARRRWDSGKRGIFKGVHSIAREEVLIKVQSQEKWIKE